MRAMGQPTPSQFSTTLSTDRADLRVRLIREELEELEQAAQRKDPSGGTVVSPELIDALVDILYVTYGMGVELGLDLEPFFELVHEANMKKGPGPVRADGKKLKPEGWEPPNHYQLLRKVLVRQDRDRLEDDAPVTHVPAQQAPDDEFGGSLGTTAACVVPPQSKRNPPPPSDDVVPVPDGIRALLRNLWDAQNCNYDELLDDEQALFTEEEFACIKSWIKKKSRGPAPTAETVRKLLAFEWKELVFEYDPLPSSSKRRLISPSDLAVLRGWVFRLNQAPAVTTSQAPHSLPGAGWAALLGEPLDQLPGSPATGPEPLNLLVYAHTPEFESGKWFTIRRLVPDPNPGIVRGVDVLFRAWDRPRWNVRVPASLEQGYYDVYSPEEAAELLQSSNLPVPQEAQLRAALASLKK